MEKKFKLINTYPGSPKLGTIITSSKWWGHICKNPGEYPEFWEEVIEKEYEILTLIITSNNTPFPKGAIITNNNEYYWTEAGWMNRHNIKSGHYDIHSVKKLSDGEVFTLGDLCAPIGKESNNKHPITKIWLCDTGDLRISSVNYTLGLNGIQKSKQPLFTTKDGKEIFEGDEFALVICEIVNYEFDKVEFKKFTNQVATQLSLWG